MEHIEQNKLAWMAGFFDGEGMITIAKYRAKLFQNRGIKGWHNDRYVVRATVTNTHRDSVEQFYRAYGGWISETKTTSDKACYTWSIEGRSAVGTFIGQIEQFCVVKHGQLMVAKEFILLPMMRRGIKTAESSLPDAKIIAQYEQVYQKLRYLKDSKSGRKPRNE